MLERGSSTPANGGLAACYSPTTVQSSVSASPNIAPDHHLRRPLPAFGRWWAYWALIFPVVSVLPDSPFTIVAWWLVGVPLFFWTGLRPLRLWMHRPKPAWLFFVLWMGVPSVRLPVEIGVIRLFYSFCCGDAR